MRDSATAGLGDQPPAPPQDSGADTTSRTLSDLFQKIVLPPVTFPPVPAEQPIEVDDDDTQPPDQPQQSMQPPMTPPIGGLLAHWLCDSFADVIAPVSFVLLSYMEEWALNATRKNRARKEATLKELKVYAWLFIEAKSAEIKFWFGNDVFDLVDIRSSSRRTLSPADGC